MAPPQTHLQYCQDLLARAYRAMHPDLGTNDEEHEVLHEMTDLIENEVRKMGGELPPPPDDDEDY